MISNRLFGSLNIVILITGATGFIGRHLTEALVSQGHQVHTLVRPRESFPIELQGSQRHIYDGSGASVKMALEKAKPDIVFHLASLFLAEHHFEDIAALCESNITFGTQLVDSMIAVKCHNLVCAGTSWQNFDGKKGVAACLYAATKEAYESVLRFYADAKNLKVIALKIFDTYGSKDTRRKLLSIIREAAKSEKSLGLSPGDQKIDLLHVSDAVSAFMVAGEMISSDSSSKGFVKEFYLRSGRIVSVKELVKIFEESSGKTLQAKWGERPYRAREVMEPWPNGDVLPGWEPNIELATGLKDYFREPSV